MITETKMIESKDPKGKGLITFVLLIVVGVIGFFVFNGIAGSGFKFPNLGDIFGGRPPIVEPAPAEEPATTPALFQGGADILPIQQNPFVIDTNGDGCNSVAEDEAFVRANVRYLEYVGVGPINETDEDVVVYLIINGSVANAGGGRAVTGQFTASAIDANGCVANEYTYAPATIRE